MPQYQVEALRVVNSLHAAYECAGRPVQAEQMRRVGEQIEAMVQALKAISELYWTDAPAPEEMREIARAALVGEEGK